MNRGLEELKKEYIEIKIPREGKEKVIMAMDKARKEKAKNRTVKFRRRIMAAAAVVAVGIILPNTNVSMAMAMENIPVIGGLFKVVTFRNYKYDDGHRSADVEVPQIAAQLAEGPEVSPAAENLEAGIESVNRSVEEYTDMLVRQFDEDAEKIGEGYQGLDVHYDVITDSDEWFTLKITVLQTQASGYEQHKFYHIDKKTGNIAQLKDLFDGQADYVTVISEEIKRQMREIMAKEEGLYFLDSEDMPEEDFDRIKPDQNFYLDDNGDVVIAFDEYEVAPGYMGSPEFTIPRTVLQDVRK